MVATDTIVGIVGAVVLVAAMAGVFVYEYNNTPDEGTTIDERFAHLSADGDIDGDGIRNADDDDIDGDGILNEDDEDIVVTVAGDGSMGPRAEPGPSPNAVVAATAEEGVKGIHATATVTPQANDPSGNLNGFQLSVTLDGADLGEDIGTSTLEVSSTDVMAGPVNAVLRPAQGSLGGDYVLTIQIIY